MEASVHPHADRLSRWPLAAACGMAVVSVVAAAAVRWSGMSIHVQDAPVAQSRALHFFDRDDGSVSVVDASNGRLVETIVGQNGFVRGTLRGLVRERKRQSIGPEEPFTLVAHVDGRLTLLDPATGRRVDLESFGPTNESEFARMLQSPQPLAAPPRPGT